MEDRMGTPGIHVGTDGRPGGMSARRRTGDRGTVAAAAAWAPPTTALLRAGPARSQRAVHLPAHPAGVRPPAARVATVPPRHRTGGGDHGRNGTRSDRPLPLTARTRTPIDVSATATGRALVDRLRGGRGSW